jgi:phage-related baseplate assembly protein
MFTLDDLTTPLTRAQVQASIYEALGTLGVSTTSWKPGAVVRTMITAVSIILAASSSLTAAIAKSGFLDLAEGDWLTLVARHVYNVERITATFATGEVTLVNAGGGVYVLAVGDLVVSNPTTGKTYRNAMAVTVNAMATVSVAIIAVESGSGSSSDALAISEIETTLLGVTCSNAASLAGLDEEADAALRTRCSEKLGSLSPNGPWDAYSYAARNAVRADGSNVGVTRVRITKDGYGNVYVYVASASGAITGTVGDTTTDLGLVDDAIQTLAAPLGVTAIVASATAYSIAVTYQAWMYNTSGLTSAQVQTLISARLLTFMSSQPIGGNVIDPDPGKIYVDAIKTAIGATRSEIFHVTVTLPAADVDLTISQVPVLGAVTCTAINQVPPSEGHV